MPNRKSSKPARASRNPIRGHVAHLYREAILEASERVFGRTGFAGARMADIAREAGIATGSLYTYFDSKEQIFQSLLDYRGEAFHGRLKEVAAGSAPPLQRLAALVREVFAFIELHRDVFSLLVAADVPGGAGPCAGAEERHEKFQAVFVDVLRQASAAKAVRGDIPPADLANFLQGAMKGVCHDWVRTTKDVPLAPRADFVLELFLAGAGVRS